MNKMHKVVKSRESARCTPLKDIYIGSSGGSYDHFRMKTKLWPFFEKADMYMAHYNVWNAYPELSESYSGFCTAAYGNTEDIMLEVDVTYDRIVDMLPVGSSEYRGSRLMYRMFNALFGASVGFLTGQLLWSVFSNTNLRARENKE
mmetsp:Transcript_13363/g.9641  ORF Transcript_13363/g.9641 Transcript_13363/m.9641 type:complete len:146 (-) Transcript_13363:20-457(-)